MWGSYASLLGEELWILSFLPIVGHYTRGGVNDKTVSQPLLPTLMWASLHLMYCSHSAGFSEEVGLVHM